MLVVMKAEATAEQIEKVKEKIRTLGFAPHSIPGAQRVAIGITGNKGPIEPAEFNLLPGVADAIRVSQPFKLVSRDVKKEDTVLDLGTVKIGGNEVVVIAGPCSVESEQQLMSAAHAVKAAGAALLRGGAYKPRTSPYEFQGLREDGLKLLARARAETGLKVVTEVKDTETVDLVAEYADVLQIGARNMQNFTLLSEVGQTGLPVMLKRGLAASVEDLLNAAEYIASEGNDRILLCERGIRTYETATRNTLDINAVPVLKKLTHLPVCVDPSHAVGEREYVGPITWAAVAVGADAIMLEIHPEPSLAMSDGAQSLDFAAFGELMAQLKRIPRFRYQTGAATPA